MPPDRQPERQPERPQRVLGYCRVSSERQAERGTSLEHQREEVSRYCSERGYPEPALYVEVESGGAGREEARVEQVRLMRDARAGDLVLVAKQDRWSRDTLHFVASVRALTAAGARFLSLAERFDASTPEGEFASTIMAAVARQEHQRIRDRTIGTRLRLRAQGLHVEGLPPLGYRVEARRLVPVEPGATVVRRMFRLALELPTRAVAERLRAEHPDVAGLDHAAVARRLADRRYLGEARSVGARGHRAHPSAEVIPGAHEALIEQELWDDVQRALSERRLRPRLGRSPQSAACLLRGLARCAHCGSVISTQIPVGPSSVTHGGYYLCSRRAQPAGREPCRGPCAPWRAVDAEAERQVLERLTTLGRALSAPSRAPRAERDRAADLRSRRADLVARRERLIDAIADGLLRRDEVRARLSAVDSELADVGRALCAHDRPRVDRRAQLAEVAELRRAWGGLDVVQRRDVLRALAERVELRSTSERRWQRGAWQLEISWIQAESEH